MAEQVKSGRQDIDVVVDITEPRVSDAPVAHHHKSNKLDAAWTWFSYALAVAVLAGIVFIAANSTTNGDAKQPNGITKVDNGVQRP